MQGDMLQQRARDRAEELPGAGLEHPFGPDWEVFTVRGKTPRTPGRSGTSTRTSRRAFT